jgi:VWFA-related protein
LTSFHDALFSTLLLSGTPGRRTLLLAYTDGLDTSSWLDPTAIAALANRSDVVVYVVTVRLRRPRGVRTWLEEGRRIQALTALAENTGGALLYAERQSEVQRTFARVAEEFRQRYLISYSPQGVDLPGWHEVQVTLKGRAGKIQARRGYFVD